MKQKINCKTIIPKRYDRILKIMKISALFFFLCTFCVLGKNIYSQNNEISLNLKNIAIKDAISKIEKETGYVFIFNEDVEVKLRDPVTIDTQNKTIEVVLSQLLKDTDLDYSIIAKQITIYVKNRRENAYVTTSTVPLKIELQQQEKTVRGKVTDKSGEPLPGVTIVVKGTSKGTTSDIDGNYILQNTFPNSILIFSFVGMRTQEVEVGNKTIIHVTIEEEAISLQEVVAVGYGVQKKESVVGAISQTSSKELMRTGNVTDLKQALGGQLPGLVTITSSGEPGGTGKGESVTDIFIRGQNTWNGGQPLILVDGIERDMSNVDVNEVQSISILKDASATAVFGVKGANGVILITTKRGENEKPKISFSYNLTAKSLSKVPDKLNSYDAILLRDESIEREIPLNEGSWLDYIPYEIAQRYKRPQIGEYAEIYPNVDWEKAMFKDVGFSQKASLSVTAGNDIVRYFGSLSYLNEGDMFKDYENNKGYNPNYDFNRFNFRNNLDFQITKSTVFKINLSGYYSQKNTNYNTEGKDDLMWAAIYSMPPDIYLPHYSDGRWGWSDTRYNPVAVIYNVGIRHIRRTQLYSDFELNQNLNFITKGLSANASFHYDNSVLSEGGLYDSSNSIWPHFATSNTPFKIINSKLYTGPNQDPSEYTILLPTIGTDPYDWYLKPWTITKETMSSVSRRITYQFQLNYTRNFGLHNVGAMGVFKREEYASGSEFRHFREDWALRATYDYDNRYLLEANGAYNGSEQFGPGYRFDFFPSLAAGWYISNEKFFNINWMNRLKVRYSTGVVGDDNVSGDRWLYVTQYASGGYSRLNASPRASSPYTWYKENIVGNPDIHWEKARKNDLGVEMGFLNDLFALNFDYYTEKREDILLSGSERSIPPFFGAVPPTTNIGRVNSNGYEINLKINKRFGRDMRLWSDIAFSHNENKIIFRDDPYYKAAYLKKEGYPIGQVKTLVRTGFYNNWDDVFASVPTETNDLQKLPGYYNLLDFNADGVISSTGDYVPYGYSDVPQNVCNFTLGFDYKRFSVMAQLYGVSNVSRSVPLSNFMIQTDVVFKHVIDYWSKDNQDATSFLPRWRTQGQNIGDYFLYDASYLRLKTVELSYTFDQNHTWLQKVGLSALRVFVNGNNLFFWSNLPDDRESNSSGGSGSNGTYPTVKRINFGIDMTF